MWAAVGLSGRARVRPFQIHTGTASSMGPTLFCCWTDRGPNPTTSSSFSTTAATRGLASRRDRPAATAGTSGSTRPGCRRSARLWPAGRSNDGWSPALGPDLWGADCNHAEGNLRARRHDAGRARRVLSEKVPSGATWPMATPPDRGVRCSSEKRPGPVPAAQGTASGSPADGLRKRGRHETTLEPRGPNPAHVQSPAGARDAESGAPMFPPPPPRPPWLLLPSTSLPSTGICSFSSLSPAFSSPCVLLVSHSFHPPFGPERMTPMRRRTPASRPARGAWCAGGGPPPTRPVTPGPRRHIPAVPHLRQETGVQLTASAWRRAGSPLITPTRRSALTLRPWRWASTTVDNRPRLLTGRSEDANGQGSCPTSASKSFPPPQGPRPGPPRLPRTSSTAPQAAYRYLLRRRLFRPPRRSL